MQATPNGNLRLHHSTVHGSTQDTRINLTQALWLADARHLDGAEAMQPVMIAPEEFGHKLTRNTAVEKYDQLPPALQQQVLYQELRREPSERTLSGKQIARRQLEMIKIHNPDMFRDVVRQQPVERFTFSQCLFRLLTFGDIMNNAFETCWFPRSILDQGYGGFNIFFISVFPYELPI